MNNEKSYFHFLVDLLSSVTTFELNIKENKTKIKINFKYISFSVRKTVHLDSTLFTNQYIDSGVSSRIKPKLTVILYTLY